MPAISVIIPVFNTEPFLANCLASIYGQTFRNFEAIVVDDGSTDGSASIAKAIAEKDLRFRIVTQENKGLSEARNAGIEAAQGDWITFVDSDDMLAPNFLQALFDAIMQTGADIACSGKLHIHLHGLRAHGGFGGHTGEFPRAGYIQRRRSIILVAGRKQRYGYCQKPKLFHTITILLYRCHRPRRGR